MKEHKQRWIREASGHRGQWLVKKLEDRGVFKAFIGRGRKKRARPWLGRDTVIMNN